MTKDQLRDAIAAKGVHAPEGYDKAQLQELYDQLEAVEAAGPEPGYDDEPNSPRG